ncbi:hypothetical protein HAX54_023045 [Datura stramonium]|uniref:BHLH domain-containing protein n=1 Tax=Datura stramonium TaxID=4076 RepID=A0ABS8UXU0_DATST|nr:hypothetical protein [Datura stramonium]
MEQPCNNPSSSSSSLRSKVDRKTIEKNRRIQMKDLYLKLKSLVPHLHQHSKEVLSLPDQLEEAANYIKKLQIDLERMRLRKESLKIIGENSSCSERMGGRSTLHIEIHNVDSALNIVLITGLGNRQLMFNDIIRILHEENVQVISASYTVIDNTVFHSIHSKMGDSVPEYGAARISERLKKFVSGV